VENGDDSDAIEDPLERHRKARSVESSTEGYKGRQIVSGFFTKYVLGDPEEMLLGDPLQGFTSEFRNSSSPGRGGVLNTEGVQQPTLHGTAVVADSPPQLTKRQIVLVLDWRPRAPQAPRFVEAVVQCATVWGRNSWVDISLESGGDAPIFTVHATRILHAQTGEKWLKKGEALNKNNELHLTDAELRRQECRGARKYAVGLSDIKEAHNKGDHHFLVTWTDGTTTKEHFAVLWHFKGVKVLPPHVEWGQPMKQRGSGTEESVSTARLDYLERLADKHTRFGIVLAQGGELSITDRASSSVLSAMKDPEEHFNKARAYRAEILEGVDPTRKFARHDAWFNLAQAVTNLLQFLLYKHSPPCTKINPEVCVCERVVTVFFSPAPPHSSSSSSPFIPPATIKGSS